MGKVVSILNREWNLDDALRVREEEKAEDIAEKMIERGTPLDFIIEVTKLSKEKVEKLAEKYNKDN